MMKIVLENIEKNHIPKDGGEIDFDINVYEDDVMTSKKLFKEKANLGSNLLKRKIRRLFIE